jgi:hypothetical protein
MRKGFLFWKRIRLITSHIADEQISRVFLSRDPDLLRISEVSRARIAAERNLDNIFEKVKPILYREAESRREVRSCGIPDDLKAQVSALTDPEQRIMAIVKFKLSGMMKTT